MPYLIIIALVAAAGVIRLYVQHRRESVTAHSVDSFLDSLQAISATPRQVPPRRSRPAPPAARRRTASDARRREQARRRVQARRTGRTGRKRPVH